MDKLKKSIANRRKIVNFLEIKLIPEKIKRREKKRIHIMIITRFVDAIIRIRS